MIKANNPQLKSWIPTKADSDFPIQNLPFGIFKNGDDHTGAASAIGDFVIDLKTLYDLGYFDGLSLPKEVFSKNTLNEFIGLGKETTRKVRERLSDLLEVSNTELQHNEAVRSSVFIPMDQVQMLLPVHIGDYTDFYSSEQHAYNVGCMFRDPDNALMPNWKHIPVGYHGRASSIAVSGTDFHRPKGQTIAPDAQVPAFGPTKRLDFELEMGFITGKANPLGASIPVAEADEYIFGFVLFNDWSARDVQKWSMSRWAPFSQEFLRSVSPWIVTMDALEPFRGAWSVETQVPPELAGRKNNCRGSLKRVHSARGIRRKAGVAFQF